MKTRKTFHCFLILAALLLTAHAASAGTLTLSFATNVISEAAGPKATTGSITLNAPLTNALALIMYGQVDTTKIFLPNGFPTSIPAGSTNVTFSIDSVNNGDIDGNKTVTLTVGADGFANSSASLLVTDDDTLTRRTVGGRLSGIVAGTNSYYVVDNITVQPSTTLQLLPGARLLFPTNLTLTCNGTLYTSPNTNAPVLFTRAGTNGNWPGLIFNNANTTTVLYNIEVSYAGGGGGITVTPPGSTTYLMLNNSKIHDNLGSGINIICLDNIYVYTNTVSITSNSIYGNGGSGVYVESLASQCNSCLNGPAIDNNEIYNNSQSGVYLDASVYYNGCNATCYTIVSGLVSGNYIHGNHEGVTYLADTGSGSGANHIRDLTTTSQNNVIVNNTGNGIGIYGSVEQNIIPHIVNNTIAGNGGAGIYHVDVSFGPVIENNLIFENNWGIQSQYGMTGNIGYMVWANNLWGNYVSNWMNYPTGYGQLLTTNLNGTAADTNMNIAVNPLTVSGVDFHLTATSPMIDAGTAYLTPTNDLDGNLRRGGFPDIGSYEFTGVALAAGALTNSGKFNLVAMGGRQTQFSIESSTNLKTWVTNLYSDLTRPAMTVTVPATNASGSFYRARIQ